MAYLFAFLLLASSIPGQIFAVMPNPPTDFSASPVDQGIQLKWQNNGVYTKQILTKIGTPSALENLEPAPQGSQSFTDTNLGQPAGNITIYSYQLQTTQGSQTDTTNASVTFLDSDIVTVKTSGGVVVTPYSIQCTPIGSDSISISWSGSNVPTSHRIQLFGADSLITPPITVGSLLGPVAGPGSSPFTDGKLKPEAQRWYVLETFDDTLKSVTWSNVVNCTTGKGEVFSDAPNPLSVFAYGSKSLYLNWKDNVTLTRPYHFEIQRIKATPQTSSKFKGVSGTSASNSFSWENTTGYSPYNSVLERSASGNPGNRFSSADLSFTSLTSNEYDPYADNNTTGNPKTKKFTYTDSGLTEATVYYYRLKACSTIPVGDLYMKSAGGNTSLNANKPPIACSEYTPGAGALATTTLPKAPSDLTAKALSPSSIEIKWQDNSAKEKGFYVYRNGAPTPVATVGASNGTGATVTYSDTGLSSGTGYTYVVKSFFTDPLNGKDLLSDDSVPKTTNSNTATTQVTLVVSKNPVSAGQVTGSGINCGDACSAVFNAGDTVVLSAAQFSGFVFSKWTGDVCNNSTNASCSFSITKDASLQANFSNSTGGIMNSISVVATLNGSPVASTNFSFSIVSGNDGSNLVPAGLHDVPFLVSTNQTGSFTFNYISGGPGAFSGINWASSAGNGGGSGTPSTGVMPAGGGGLSFTVLFTSAGANVPSSKSAFSLSQSIGDAWRAVTSALSDGWKFIAESVRGIDSGLAQTLPYESYFNLKKFSITAPSYIDSGLDPNSIYLYRVRVVYDDNASPKSSFWSDTVAAKTLADTADPSDPPAGPICGNGICETGETTLNCSIDCPVSGSGPRGGGPPGGRTGVCKSNNLCDFSGAFTQVIDSRGIVIEQSEFQCRVNADCRDVGRLSKTFQEQ